MLNQHTYKQRVIVLFAGFIMVLFLVYKIALKETVEKKRNYKNIKNEIAQAENAPQLISSMQSKIAYYDQLLGTQHDNPEGIRDMLLEYVSSYCQKSKVMLKSFPQSHEYISNNYLVETSIMVIQGSFIKLLKLLFEMETNPAYGKIQAVEFESYVNIRTKRKVLTMKMYLQNIKSLSDED